jgi:GDP-L-fucose synthase
LVLRDAASITTPTRDSLSGRDAAEAILDVTEATKTALPVNVGSGTETPIRELVETIASVTGFAGDIEWDTTKPDGQAACRHLAGGRALWL